MIPALLEIASCAFCFLCGYLYARPGRQPEIDQLARKDRRRA